MVFEPNFTKVVSSSRKNIGMTQSVIELNLPTNEDVINAIYSISAKSAIVSSEVVGNTINFVGLVDFQAMYESNGISAIDYSAEFKDKFTYTEDINGEVVLSSNVVDVNSNIVSNGIKVVAIIEVTIDEITTKDVNILTNVEGENICTSSKKIELSSYLGKATEKYDFTQEFEIKDAIKVLMVTPSVCLNNVVPNENYLTVNGVLNVDVCYQIGENNYDIKNIAKSFDFNFDVALTGIEETSYIQSIVSLISNEIKVSTILEEDNSTISLYIPIIYTGYVFTKSMLDVVDDVYSKTNYLSITSENFDTIDGMQSINFKDAISGTASILDTAPFIDDILGVCTNNIVLASSRVENGILNIEGVANATVVYYTKETNSITSVQVEMPFSVEQKIEGEISNVVTLCLANVNARSKRGKEIEVSADLSVYSDMYRLNDVCVVSNISLGDEKPQDDCALYIYIVKPNETVWDIAKDMNVSQELILEQNPEIELPLKGGEKIVIYKPNLIGFDK